jgi:hypothetical protein
MPGPITFQTGNRCGQRQVGSRLRIGRIGLGREVGRARKSLSRFPQAPSRILLAIPKQAQIQPKTPSATTQRGLVLPARTSSRSMISQLLGRPAKPNWLRPRAIWPTRKVKTATLTRERDGPPHCPGRQPPPVALRAAQPSGFGAWQFNSPNPASAQSHSPNSGWWILSPSTTSPVQRRARAGPCSPGSIEVTARIIAQPS